MQSEAKIKTIQLLGLNFIARVSYSFLYFVYSKCKGQGCVLGTANENIKKCLNIKLWGLTGEFETSKNFKSPIPVSVPRCPQVHHRKTNGAKCSMTRNEHSFMMQVKGI